MPRRFPLLILSLFLLAASVTFIPRGAEAAPFCYCDKPKLPGNPCPTGKTIKLQDRIVTSIGGEWNSIGAPITSLNDCKDECYNHLLGTPPAAFVDDQDLVNGQYFVNGQVYESCFDAYTIDRSTGQCVSPPADDPTCGTVRACFCGFKTDAKDTNYVNVGCTGRLWQNLDIHARGSAGDPACQVACSAFLGHPAMSGTDYMSTNDTNSFCYYGTSYMNTRCPSIVNYYPDDPARSQCKPRFCYCKYPDTFSVPACKAKTVYRGPVANNAVCAAICPGSNLEFYKTYDNLVTGCNFIDSSLFTVNDPSLDHCAKPLNPTASDCANVGAANQNLLNAQSSAVRQSLMGSVLGLNLPLSDISLPALIARVIRQLLSVVGALALAFFVWGGLMWMTARGEEAKITKAKGIITAAVSGLVAIFASYAVLNLIINALSK